MAVLQTIEIRGSHQIACMHNYKTMALYGNLGAIKQNTKTLLQCLKVNSSLSLSHFLPSVKNATTTLIHICFTKERRPPVCIEAEKNRKQECTCPTATELERHNYDEIQRKSALKNPTAKRVKMATPSSIPLILACDKLLFKLITG